MEELDLVFRKRFEVMEAGEIYEQLRLRNPEKFIEAVESFNGDMEELNACFQAFLVFDQRLAEKKGETSIYKGTLESVGDHKL